MSNAAVTRRRRRLARLRSVALEPLRRGQPPGFRTTGGSDDGRLSPVRRLVPSGLVPVEGVCAARPELADLVDLAVLAPLGF